MITVGLSLAERVAALPAQMRDEWIDSLDPDVIHEMLRGEWWYVARPEQIPPEGDWLVALALAGRGWGKSRAGSEWLTEQVLKHPFDRGGQPTEWLLIGETLADTRTICLEGPAGMLRVLHRRGIEHRYKQSPRPMILFPDGAKIYAEGADDADVGRGYNAAGAWVDEICVAEGELVATDRGWVPIQDVQKGDLALTRNGWSSVTDARLSRKNANLVEVVTAQGSVRVTPDHRIWTREGWRRADQLTTDSVLTCLVPRYQSQAMPPPFMSGMERSGTSANGGDITQTVTDLYSTGLSGLISTVQYPTDTRSTTKTACPGITKSETWRSSLPLPTGHSRGSNDVNSLVPKSQGGSRLSSAMRAVPSSSLPTRSSVVVAESATLRPEGSWLESNVLDVRKVEPSDVYDLTVEGEFPEFVAGSGHIIVHNCKWPKPYDSWYSGILPSLRTDLVNDHPRCFATTTPKPIKLLQEWMQRDDGTIHVMGGATFDNATNLSAHVLRELKLRYAGTALGQQELYGKMLALNAGGLFKRMDIVDYRVDSPPDDITSTVVGCDPNLTGEDATFGIVVVARTVKNEMYVLQDASVKYSGRQAALAIWRAAAEWKADLVVYEENLGKRYLFEILRDTYNDSIELGLFPKHTSPPMKPVHAKHGKKTRAEPVALRAEQGRLHMVGEFVELEDEMVMFDPDSTRESPDRMDALVHACLHLMAGERRRMGAGDPSKYTLGWDQGVYGISSLI